jgi:DHA1 family inner membrane transport protein
MSFVSGMGRGDHQGSMSRTTTVTSTASTASTGTPDATDLNSRHAAMALGLSLPADVVLYLLLPMYASRFGVTLAEVGMLLAANRLVRIAGYGFVARFYARHGDRLTCTLAVLAAAVCGLGYATLSGFWALLPLRLTWGLCFAALNLSTQALATAEPAGAARRNGRSRAFIAVGPVIALPLGAVLAHWSGPRVIFGILAVFSLAAWFVTRRLPAVPHAVALPRPDAANSARRFKRPNSLDAWSFMEGLALDGLFIVGLSYLGKDLMPGGAVIVAGVLLALRYLAEIVLSPVGGHMAERFGAERLLVSLSLVTAVALVGFGLGWLWSCAALIVVLRALQLPLLPPIVARRTPGPERVQALAARSVWRDIGAGTGPLIAGLLLPVASPPWIYGVAALLLAATALACGWSPAPAADTARAAPR